MDRNLWIRNGLPCKPIRSWVKRIGPVRSAATAIATTAMTGESASRSVPDTTTSTARLSWSPDCSVTVMTGSSLQDGSDCFDDLVDLHWGHRGEDRQGDGPRELVVCDRQRRGIGTA
jgi:hypothetical protein